MPVAKKMIRFIENSSWIRKMFEEGAKLKAQYGEVVSAEFLPTVARSSFSLGAGVIGLGPGPVDASGVKGLEVTGRWPELEIGPWVDWVSALPTASGQGGDAAALLPALGRIDAEFGAIDVFGEVFSDVRVGLDRSDPGDWSSRFSSDRLAGTVSIPRANPRR